MTTATVDNENAVYTPEPGVPFSYQYTEPKPEQRLYTAKGGALKFLYCRDPVILLDGPAGTGKTRSLLEKGLILMEKYPGIRVLLLRKTRKSLTQSAIVTWEQKVLPVGWESFIPFHTTDQEYQHANGSIMAVAGLDDPAKVMSTEWDFIIIPEATELLEEELEYLTTRNRNFGGGIPFQQIAMDCNPQAPTHWLNVRCEIPIDPKNPQGPKLVTRILSRHKDNPEYWDDKLKTWTARGRAYLSNLKKLSGVRFFRLFKGIWRQAEGMVFEEYNPDIHRVFHREVPDSWARYWGVDFGYRHAFCWQEWAQDEDGRLWLVNEIYVTERLVADCAKDILAVTGNIRIRPRAVICDHDAEGRATLERELGILTTAAYKDNELENIEAVKRRLRQKGNGLTGILFMRDSLYERDASLEERHLPTETVGEFDGYVWDDKKKKERPVNVNDHGMKTMEYVIGYVDKVGPQAATGVKQESAYGEKKKRRKFLR